MKIYSSVVLSFKVFFPFVVVVLITQISLYLIKGEAHFLKHFFYLKCVCLCVFMSVSQHVPLSVGAYKKQVLGSWSYRSS